VKQNKWKSAVLTGILGGAAVTSPVTGSLSFGVVVMGKNQGVRMVISGHKAYALKCEKCGHEDVLFFRDMFCALKEIKLKIAGKKCSECGKKMVIDPSQRIVF